MKSSIVNFNKNYPKLYNIVFEDSYLKDSPHEIIKSKEFNMLSSGEQILCNFAFFLWNNSFGFNLEDINNLDNKGRKFILKSLNDLYNYEN